MKTVVAIVAAIAVSAAASVLPAPAHAALDCRVVESLGNHLRPQIVRGLDAQIAGHEQRISRRKTLVVHGTRSLGLRGCYLDARFDVTLKRKIRRNAHGHVRIEAKVVEAGRDHLCLSEVRVTEVNLSRTLRIGEAVYRGVANRAIPNRQCFYR